MNLFRHYQNTIIGIIADLAAAGSLPQGLDARRVSVEPPRDASHGDIATNAAMALAKPAGVKPRDLAEMLKKRLDSLDSVVSSEIAGPGFINMRLADRFWRDRLIEILKAGPAYGDSAIGAGETVNVEYVSANPTGPMHVGHGRGAVVGDALASLLEKAGFNVTREYYINDAGAQVDTLARSLHLRYRQALGEDIGKMPEGLYPGDYLIPVGRELAERDGRKWIDKPESLWLETLRTHAVEAMMNLIRSDLAALGVKFDKFTSENHLVNQGEVQAAYQILHDKGLIYQGVLDPPKGKTPDDWEARPQTLFKASEFGDDVDRPLQKADGSWTYFATDAAYHLDKFRRGFKTMIDVWGADHGGYVKRVSAAVKALTGGEGAVDVKLCQMINLVENGVPVKMSKRAGAFVTLRGLIDEVGKDVVRFIMLTRKNDAHLDFDLVKVTEQSRDNPVFYVQYAHARVYSVLRHAASTFSGEELEATALAEAQLQRLTDADELALIKVMAAWPQLVESAAEAHEPHRVAFYLNDLASSFHGLWNKGNDDAGLRFIVKDDHELTRARLALIKGAAIVIASGLKVIGVTPLEELR
ncbi:MAG: arginine--tRNA ligase [Rhodospirillales bacterium RIFCSPLOWO2_12_FULL_58_28]|nr:MAG: arginine--tRNA ligase [Rhodospirillales bacterium RIFCSPLOWO2_02_FULL_58_16]OHC79728.1 MAG: arginine--tRNA ligase [Rhodospirillales bacterium RIFCSPLOWO2_12_FULL_58_28]